MTSPMTDPGATELNQSELVRLRMALGRVGRMLRQQGEHELPHALIAIMFAIHRSEPVTAKVLAEGEGVTPPAVTRSLARLEEVGYITRVALDTDRRVQEIRLSPAGEAKRVELLHQREMWLTSHLERLTADELDDLVGAIPALEKLGGFTSSSLTD